MFTQSTFVLTNSKAVEVTVKKSIADTFDLEIETENGAISIHCRKLFLQKLANVLRNVTYPMNKEERVPICLNGTISKKFVENTQCTPTTFATMCEFMSSLSLDDVTLKSAESSSKTANSTSAVGRTMATDTILQPERGLENDT